MTFIERSGAGGGFVLIDCVTALSFCNSDDDEKLRVRAGAWIREPRNSIHQIFMMIFKAFHASPAYNNWMLNNASLLPAHNRRHRRMP